MQSQLSPEQIRKKIEQIAVRLLHRREHSVRELEIKLQQRGYEKTDIDAVLEILQKRKWQSDHRFIETFINNRVSRGYGELRIKAELQQKGIEQQDIESALQALNLDWQGLATQLYQRKYSTLPADDNEKQKRIRFMSQRGFSFEQILGLVSIDPD